MIRDNKMIDIDKAELSDVKSIIQVMRNSILSCHADHHNNQASIDAWLANKTEENLALWIAHNYSLVCKQDNSIVGFFMASATGEILLNYVEPNRQQQGIGKSLLDTAKAHYHNQGIDKLSAESTITAKAFYQKNGFEVMDEIVEEGKLVAYRMVCKI